MERSHSSLKEHKISEQQQELQINFKYPGLVNQSIEIDGVSLSLWSLGKIDPRKLTILCFAGWPFSGYVYWPMGALIQDKIQYVGIDIPGFIGLSDAPEFVVTAENVGNLISKLPELLNLRKYGILGYSAGGVYALSTFQKIKENLPKQNMVQRILKGKLGPKFVILLAPAINGKKVSYFRTPEFTRTVYEQMKARGNFLGFIDKTIASTFGKNLLRYFIVRSTKEQLIALDLLDKVERELHELLKGINKEALLSSAEDIINHDRSEELKSIDVPVLFLSGAKDAVTLNRETKKLLKHTKDGQCRVIKDGTHLFPVTHYDKVAQHIVKFLQKKSFI